MLFESVIEPFSRPTLSVNDANATAAAPQCNELVVVLRIPKSASTTLSVIAAQAFSRGRSYVLPNTLDMEGALSPLQRLRHARHAAQIAYREHRLLRLAHIFDLIEKQAQPGDLLTGGHIDFTTCRENIRRPLKFVTLLRNPIDRSLSEYAYARAGHARKSPLARFDASLLAKTASRYAYEGYLDFLLEHRTAFADLACRHIGLTPGDDVAAHFARHAFHFGNVDNLRGFAHGLGKKTGRHVQVEHRNRGTRHVARILTRAEQAKLETLYARDLALYEWCRRQEQPMPHPVAVQVRHAVMA